MLLPNLFRTKLLFLSILIGLTIFTIPAIAQLKGTYTINGTVAASATNYKTFSSAVSDLVSATRADGGTANGKGVSGAVVFKITNGTYAEQISIPTIIGASAANTITFQSAAGDSSKVILTSASSNAATTNYTLELNTARYITFKQITISRTGGNTNAIAVALTGNTAFNQFIGNLFKGKYDPSTTTLGIVAGNALINSTGADSSCLFTGNRFKMGYNSIAMVGTSYGYNNIITNNIFDTAGMAGVYSTNFQTNILISGNIFNMGPFVIFPGHYISYGVRLESAINYKIVKNKFYATSGASVSRCIVLFFGTTSGTTRNLLANNFAWVSAGSTSSTGITLGGNANLDVVYNNVLMTSVPSSSAALYVYPQYAGSANIVKNNNLINKGTGTAVDNSNDSTNASSLYTTGIAIENNNNLYTKGTYIGNYRGTLYTTLANWQTAIAKINGSDANSITTDPGYVSNTDLHVSSAAIYQAGVPYPGITDDIDGDLRPGTKPCIGADEFVPNFLDAGITSLDSPSTFCAPKTANIYVKFTNFGQNTLTSLKINWSINGAAQTAYNWSGSVATGILSSSINIGKFSFTSTANYVVKIWTSGPNGGTDQKATNDTLIKNIASGLSGTYTMGGASPDFPTFNSVLDAITLRGLCGPTTINVRYGTYTEQLSVPNYPSLSAINTLTFQSEKGDSSQVILTLPAVNANGVNNVIVQLNGCRYVTFKKMTILRSGTGIYQSVVEIKGKSTNNAFLNNQLIGVKLTATSTTSDVITSAADKDTSNLIKNNLIRYGNSAINISGDASSHETYNVIDGNQVDSCYATAINAIYNDAISIKNNIITHACYGNLTYSGIYLNNCNSAINITANKIYMPYGGSAGIYLFTSVSKSGTEGLIANNYVSLAKGTSPAFGIFDSLSTFQNFYYNSVNMYNANTGAAFYANAAGNINLKNNILYNNGGGYSIFEVNTAAIVSSNYNDLSGSISKVGNWGGKLAGTLPTWQSISGLDANSLSVNPGFFSNTDYHTISPDIHGKAIPLSLVTTDIEGKLRNVTKPSIGALEFKTARNDASVSGLGASAYVCQGLSNVGINLKNAGSDTLKTVTINWQMNGVPQKPYSFTGKMKPDSIAFIIIGSYNFAAGFPVIKAWTSLPNGKSDSFPNNDTLSASIIVTPTPNAVTGSSTTICTGQNIAIGGSTVSGDTYSWTSIPAGFTSTFSSQLVSPSAKTTYILTETTAIGCTKTDSVTISVNPTPTANAGADRTECSGDTTVIGTVGVTGNKYSWTTYPVGFSSTLAQTAVAPSFTTIYILAVTNTSGCKAIDSINIKVNPKPNATVIKPQTICSGTTLSLGGSAVTGNTYSWSTNSGGYSSTLSNPGVSPTVTTKYILLEKTTATGCFTINTTTITVVNTPSAAFNGPKNVCTGTTTVYAPAQNSNGVSYTFSPAVTPNTTYTLRGDSFYVTWGNTGTAEIIMLAKVTTGTCQDTSKINITVNPSPTAKFTANEVCAGSITSFTNAATGASRITWFFGDGDTISTGSTTHLYKNAGIYKTKLVALNTSGCQDSMILTVKVDTVPNISYKTPASICLGTAATFTNKTVSAKSYTWDFGDGNTDLTTSPTHTYTKAGTYHVKLTATSKAGCTDTGSSFFTVNPVPLSNFKLSHGHGFTYTFIADDTSQKTYVWDLGDTSGAHQGFDVTNTYKGIASYLVKLTVINASGCSATHDTSFTASFNTAIAPQIALAYHIDIYPNPFVQKTTLSYSLANEADVKVILTDIAGRQVALVTKSKQSAGEHSCLLDADLYHLQPGIYFVNMMIDDVPVTKKIVKVE